MMRNELPGDCIGDASENGADFGGNDADASSIYICASY